MKKLTTLFLLCFSLFAVAQTDSLNLYTPSALDLRLLDFTLQWLDTTACDSATPIFKEPDSIYEQRLCDLPCIIEMSYNPVVKSFIELYLGRNRKQVARMQHIKQLYFPLFEEQLHRFGLPEELKYLPVIESGLNASARSKMGAAGLWQFMPQTGKNSGLEINSLVDERLDPLLSTQAACRFLLSLYRLYDDWNLAIAAYNCGAGNVNKAIHRAGGKRDFWDIYPFLPAETRSYLPIFVAANYVFNYADEHHICPTPVPIPLATDTILTSQRLHLQQVAAVTGVPLATLRYLNPQYTWDILPGGKAYALCLPVEATGLYLLNTDSIYAYKADSLINNRRAHIDNLQKTAGGAYSANGMTYYKVKRGDTLGALAKRFHCSVAQIQRWNGLKGTNIQIGQTLKIHR